MPHDRTLRRALADSSRHADELGVLNDLARGLAGLRDPREVVAEVAAQARRLLGVDIAYLMLLQEDGTLRTEVVSGAYGRALWGIVVEAGSGLAGQVLRTGRPSSTDDYAGDPAFPHVAAVDDAAASERLSGLLAVPLLVGDETLGVLCAATRRRHHFDDDATALLSGLAAHAAIAISNARLFARYRAAVTALEEANTALRRTATARERAADLRDSLAASMIGGADLDGLLEQLHRFVGGRLVVVDTRCEVLAGDRDPAIVAPLRAGDPPGSRGPGRAGTWTVESPLGPIGVAAVRLVTGPAGLLLRAPGPGAPDGTAAPGGTEPEEIEPGEIAALLGIAATSTALHLTARRSVEEAELRTRGELLALLLAADGDERAVRRRAAAARVDLDAVAAVAVLAPTGADTRSAAVLAGRLAAELDGWSAEHGGQLVALLSRGPAGAVREALVRLGGDDPGATVAVDACDGGIAAVRASITAGRRAVAVLSALGRDGDCALVSELGPYRAVFSTAGHGELLAFVEHAIGVLLDRDREHGSDLAGALAAYLDSGHNHTRAAARLHVHPNTLYRRLEQITALLGPDWREPPRSVEIQLALHLDRLARRLPPPG